MCSEVLRITPSSPRSLNEPATSSIASSRAIERAQPAIAPSRPSAAAASCSPVARSGHFSGSRTSCAPRAAASRTRPSAAVRLASLSAPATVCTAAARSVVVAAAMAGLPSAAERAQPVVEAADLDEDRVGDLLVALARGPRLALEAQRLAEHHRDAREAQPLPVADPRRAVDRDRHDRRAGVEDEAADAGPRSLGQEPGARAPALRVHRDDAAALEEIG